MLLEDFYVLKLFKEKINPDARFVVAYQERELSKLEAMLISPDYAANYQSAIKLGIISENLAEEYSQAMKDLEFGSIKQAVFIGDKSLAKGSSAINAVTKLELSLGILSLIHI